MITPPLRSAVVVLGLLSAPAPIPQSQSRAAQALTIGAPVQRELPKGDSHPYTVEIAADQYLHVTIEQRGVDIAATLTAPDGTKQADVNVVKGGAGIEIVTFIAGGSGTYRIEVRPAEQSDAVGGYIVTLAELRSPTPDERTLEEARRLSMQARALRDAGQYDKAVAPAERVIALREQVLGPAHLDVAHALHFLAILYDDLHEYVKAEPLNDRALAIREKELGPNHPDVARSLFNLAWLYKVKQDFPRSEAAYRRALAIQERALGPDHSEVATTLNDLAVLYNQRGEM